MLILAKNQRAVRPRRSVKFSRVDLAQLAKLKKLGCVWSAFARTVLKLPQIPPWAPFESAPLTPRAQTCAKGNAMPQRRLLLVT